MMDFVQAKIEEEDGRRGRRSKGCDIWGIDRLQRTAKLLLATVIHTIMTDLLL